MLETCSLWYLPVTQRQRIRSDARTLYPSPDVKGHWCLSTQTYPSYFDEFGTNLEAAETISVALGSRYAQSHVPRGTFPSLLLLANPVISVVTLLAYLRLAVAFQTVPLCSVS